MRVRGTLRCDGALLLLLRVDAELRSLQWLRQRRILGLDATWLAGDSYGVLLLFNMSLSLRFQGGFKQASCVFPVFARL